jgi:signal transduction histidine kinase
LGRDINGEANHIVANIRNATSQRNYEHQLLTIHRLTTDLVQIHDPNILANMILTASTEVLGANASGIFMINLDTKQISKTLTYNLSKEYSERIQQDYQGLPGEDVLKTRQPVHINDTLNNPIYGERIHFMAKYDVHALLILPVIIQDTILGALAIYYNQPHIFELSEIQIGQTLAQTLAIAHQNAKLYQGEQNQRILAEALAQAAAMINSSLELEQVLDLLLEQVMRVIPCRAANIIMLENEKGVIKSHRGYEDFSQYLNIVKNQQLSLKMPNFSKMISTGEACLIADISQDPQWSTLEGGEWIQGYAAIPLKIDRQVVGFLNIDSDQPNYFSEKTVQSLEIFADYASTAIKNARIYENSRQRAEEMEALVTAATAVSKSLDMMQVLQIIAEQMTKVLNVKACAISHYDPELNQVTLLTEHGPSGGKDEAKWVQPYDLAQHPPTRQVLEKNEPIHLHIEDPNLNEGERRFMEEAKVASLLMLPLVTQDRTIGLVELMDMQTGRKFSPREIDLGLSLASHAASAIENANLYRRLQDYAQELERRVEKRTQQLQSATDYLEDILASVPDAIFVLDENQEILRTNQAGEKLRCQAKATGLDLFHPQLLKTLKDGDEPNIHSILEVQGRAYQALSSKMNHNDSQPTKKIIIFRDVTHFRELDQIKTQFVSDVSHELRTPLTNLSLYLGLLTNVEDPQKQNDYMLTLQRETDRLTHLIEDLLTISRLEASRIQFQIRATDINQLVENLVCDRAFFAAQKEILLDFLPAKNLPAALADENMLTQAISNLLTNAINYTLPNGSIHVRTTYPETDWITIEIADTGVGIPAAEIERIFDRFYRGGASQETGAEGTGLGLSISEEIIHRLNGKISLESLPGEGSTFTIWLRTATSDML